MNAQRQIASWPAIFGIAVVGGVAAMLWDEVLDRGELGWIAVLLCFPLILAVCTGMTHKSARSAIQTFLVATILSAGLLFAGTWLLFNVLIPL